MLLGSASSALLRGLRISINSAVKCLIEGVKVGSQLLVSVNSYETIQSLQGAHVSRDVVVSESVERALPDFLLARASYLNFFSNVLCQKQCLHI